MHMYFYMSITVNTINTLFSQRTIANLWLGTYIRYHLVMMIYAMLSYENQLAIFALA